MGIDILGVGSFGLAWGSGESPVEAQPTAWTASGLMLRSLLTWLTSTVMPRSLKEPACTLHLEGCLAGRDPMHQHQVGFYSVSH